MFTGLIQQLGSIERFERHAHGASIGIRLALGEPLLRGESVAINGCCLTALDGSAELLSADLSNETLERTTLGKLTRASRVNVERALRASDRLGGHIVQGHVDAVGSVSSVRDEGAFRVIRWSFPAEYSELLVDKGSIAVDGVSLTVVEPDDSSFGAALIPETLARTNLGVAQEGDRVNLEFDVLAKYAQRMLQPIRTAISR
jgi:riboflavin synthase